MHQHTRAAIALTLTGSLTAAGATAMAAAPARKGVPHVTAAAKAAGVTTVGGAYMGWSAHSAGRPVLPDRRAAGMPARALGAGAVPGPAGVDVSAWDGPIDWATLHSGGTQFAYIKATEGNYYTSSTYTQQYDASQQAGLIRGAYHFANPAVSTGASQASYFVAHGGGWVPGGSTLPGVLDIEYDPYGPTCYGQSTTQMVNWIASFTDQYKKLTGRDAVIYAAADWWDKCTANTTRFNGSNPLWVARYAPTPGTLPGNWATYTFWQHTSIPNDQDWFNGTITQLTDLAHGTPPAPAQVPRPAHLRVLHYGMSGADVTYAQELLNLLGSHLVVDGDDGPATVAAVTAFQSKEHLAADAIVGPITWSHLQAAAGQHIDPAPTPAPTPTPTPTPTQVPRPAYLRVLHYGMSGADVLYAQELLNLLGSHLVVDGNDGPATVAAVTAFQSKEHLAADAIVGPITWSHLQAATGQ